MTRSAPLSSLFAWLARFVGDRRGVSAVEFALLLPLMMTLYIGGFEVSQAVGISRKVTLTARSVTDLVAQSQTATVTNADMANILAAAAAVIAPYSSSILKVTVSRVDIDSNGNATIFWSDAINTSPRPIGQVVTLAGALAIPSTSLIWGEVQYNYAPNLGYAITGSLLLKDQMYMRPRMYNTLSRVP